jgi:hypothetical protein
MNAMKSNPVNAMKRTKALGKLILSIVLGTVCSVLLTGCKSETVSWTKAKDPFAKKNAKKSAEPKLGVPERLVVIWKDAVYEHPAVPPTRGIGGRLYFYDSEDNPIKVDGEVVIYGFDDTAGDDKTEADKKFVFKQESFASHYNATALGPSYSIWLPWDKLGGKELSVSLIPVFRDASGKVVRSGQTVCVLPGPDMEQKVETPAKKSSEEELISSFTSMPGVQQIATTADVSGSGSNQTIAHLQESNSGPEVNQGGSKIRSTTISLPSDTAMRLQQASRGVNLPVAPTTANPTTNTAVAPQMSTPADAGSIHSPLLPADGSLTTGKAGVNSSNRDSGRKVFGLPGSLK